MADELNRVPDKELNGNTPSDTSIVEDKNSTPLEMRFYILGCIIVIFAGFIFYKVFFAPETCLNQKQLGLLKFLLPIVGGFLAWTFSGKISVNTDKIIPGLIITAFGGFAIYILSSHIFDLKDSPMACNIQVIEEDKLERIAHDITNLNASFSDSKLQPENLPQVNEKALKLLKQLEGLPDDESGARKVYYNNYIASTALMASMTFDITSIESEDAKKYANVALNAANNAIATINILKRSPDIKSLDNFAENDTEDKAIYYKGLSQILLLQLANQDQESTNIAVNDIVNTFNKVDAKVLKKWALKTDSPVIWFCDQHPEVKKICET